MPRNASRRVSIYYGLAMKTLERVGLALLLVACGGDDTVGTGLDGSTNKDSATADGFVESGSDSAVPDSSTAPDAAMAPDTSVLTCDGGQTVCNGVCVDTTMNDKNCSMCGSDCKGPSCCASACTDHNIDLKNCGGCGKVCPNVANGAVACNQANCVIATCNGGFADCDKQFNNGCEVNTTSDIANCGTCGKQCGPYNNGMAGCAAGKCTLVCKPGLGDCNNILADGCEAALNTNANCGSCGKACPNIQSCVNFQCQ